MNALEQIACADADVLRADAQLALCVDGVSCPFPPAQTLSAIASARQYLDEARGNIGAVRLALRAEGLTDALEHSEVMAYTMREAAKLGNFPAGEGIHLQATEHETRATALRALVGTSEAPTTGGTTS